MFRYDCVLYSVVTSQEDQQLLIKAQCADEERCPRHSMKLNIQLSSLMHITSNRESSYFAFTLHNGTLPRVNKYKYLGGILSWDLTWRKHVERVRRKSIYKLWYLRRQLFQAPPSVQTLGLHSSRDTSSWVCYWGLGPPASCPGESTWTNWVARFLLHSFKLLKYRVNVSVKKKKTV